MSLKDFRWQDSKPSVFNWRNQPSAFISDPHFTYAARMIAAEEKKSSKVPSRESINTEDEDRAERPRNRGRVLS